MQRLLSLLFCLVLPGAGLACPAPDYTVTGRLSASYTPRSPDVVAARDPDRLPALQIAE